MSWKEYHINLVKNEPRGGKKKKYAEVKKQISLIKKDLKSSLDTDLKSDDHYHVWILSHKHKLYPVDHLQEGFSQELINKNPQLYLKSMIYICLELENRFGVCPYQPLPLRTSFIPKYIDIDTTVLIDLFYPRKYANDVTGHKDEVWSECFKTELRIFRCGFRCFDHRIVTDGYSVSIQMRKALNVKDKYLACEKLKFARSTKLISNKLFTEKLGNLEDNNPFIRNNLPYPNIESLYKGLSHEKINPKDDMAKSLYVISFYLDKTYKKLKIVNDAHVNLMKYEHFYFPKDERPPINYNFPTIENHPILDDPVDEIGITYNLYNQKLTNMYENIKKLNTIHKERIEYCELSKKNPYTYTKEPFPYLEDLTDAEIEELKVRKWIVVDPGKRCLLYMKDNEGKTFKYNNRNYLDKTKRLVYQKRMEKYKKKHRKGIILREEAKLSATRSKSCKSALFENYIRIRNRVSRILTPEYGKMIFRRYNFWSYINKQREMATLAQQIKTRFACDNPILIYGDWSIGKSLRNFISTPNISIQRMLAKYFTIYSIDEYNTSKLSNLTHRECGNLIVTEDSVLKEVHAVLTHRNEINGRMQCINRDENASRNMKKIVEHFLITKERLEPFRRSTKSAAQWGKYNLKETAAIEKLILWEILNEEKLEKEQERLERKEAKLEKEKLKKNRKPLSNISISGKNIKEDFYKKYMVDV